VLSLVQTKVQVVKFDLMTLFDELFLRCHARDISPVRYLQLDGDKPHGGVPGRWRPSSLNYCMRKQVYKARRCKKNWPPPNAQQQFNMFDRGHVLGAWAGAYFKAMEVEGLICNVHTQARDSEEAVACDLATKLGGKVDVLFDIYWAPGAKSEYIVEVKSKENAKVMRDMTSAEKVHVQQLNDYMGMTGRRFGWVLYLAPESTIKNPEATKFAIKAFPHDFDVEMWEATAHRCHMLDSFYDAPHLLAPKTRNEFFECGSCKWYSPCHNEVTPDKAAKSGEALPG